jgi:hypothetical protein
MSKWRFAAEKIRTAALPGGFGEITMNGRAGKAFNREQQRHQMINEHITALEPDWAERNKPGFFGCHELLDRTHVIAELLWQRVVTHPACVRDPDWYALAEKAFTALDDLYQRIGAEHL